MTILSAGIIGFIIGWLFQLMIDFWYFRRSDGENDVLRGALDAERQRVQALEAELAKGRS